MATQKNEDYVGEEHDSRGGSLIVTQEEWLHLDSLWEPETVDLIQEKLQGRATLTLDHHHHGSFQESDGAGAHDFYLAFEPQRVVFHMNRHAFHRIEAVK